MDSHNGKGVLIQPVLVIHTHVPAVHGLELNPRGHIHSPLGPKISQRSGAGGGPQKTPWSPLTESLRGHGHGQLGAGIPSRLNTPLGRISGGGSTPRSPDLSPMRRGGGGEGRDGSPRTPTSLRVVDMRALLAGPPKTEDAGLDERLVAGEAVSLLAEMVRRRWVRERAREGARCAHAIPSARKLPMKAVDNPTNPLHLCTLCVSV